LRFLEIELYWMDGQQLGLAISLPPILESKLMTPYQKRPCPLTIRLAEDLKIRHMSQRTIDAYTYHAGKFADFIDKPLDCVTPEDVRSFQLHLIEERKLAYSSFNQAVCALRFLYTHTIRVNWPVTMVPYGKRPKTLPVVLGRQEVDTLLQCTQNLKQRMFLTTLYATGMRFSEAAHLQVRDIDSERMQIRIIRGKGAKDRQVPLSPRLLTELREYWKQYRPTLLLFPGNSAEKTYCDTSIQKAIKQSAELAKISKNVTPHTLRWVSYIQPPPTKTSTASQVVRYLTRYLTGGPISDLRIIATDTDTVTFLAREGVRVGGEQLQVPIKISKLEFMRRWCDHIQPDQLTKTRYFGGWCSRNRTKYQATCRELLGLETDAELGKPKDPVRAEEEVGEDSNSASTETLGTTTEEPDSASQGGEHSGGARSRRRCSVCEKDQLRLIQETAKPSWSSLLTHLDNRCPDWYAESDYTEFCEYLDREYGISYSDWSLGGLRMGIESTMEPSVSKPAEQLYFAGFQRICPTRGYLIDSF